MSNNQWYVVVAVYCGPKGELVKESSPLHQDVAQRAVEAIRQRCGMCEQAYLRPASSTEVRDAMEYSEVDDA